MERWGATIASFLGQLWYNGAALTGAFGAVLLAAAERWSLWFIVGIVLSVAAAVIALVAAPRVGRLVRGERASAERARDRARSMGAVMEITLTSLLDDLAIDASRARASVYRHGDGAFIMLARASVSERLKSPGRGAYPDDEGIIGVAWDVSVAHAYGLPGTEVKWKRECVTRWGMSQVAVDAIKMRSRSLLGVRIDADGVTRRPVGLIVIESLEPDAVGPDEVEALWTLQSWKLIRQVLHEVVECLDDVHLAGTPAT